MAQEKTYYAKGIHCVSCEINIERKILEVECVKSVNVSATDNKLTLESECNGPTAQELNKLFKKEGYTFSEQPFIDHSSNKINPWTVAIFSAAVILAFVLINKLGLGGLLNINSSSSLFVIFMFGATAGISSCAALVGGLVLSMSKQWESVYSIKDSTTKRMEPHLIFNLGRILSYGFFGAVLGGIGQQIKLSQNFAPFLIIIVSVVMITLGLQMLGVKALKRFQLTIPKVITRNIADERNFKGKYMPLVLGALTFFLPCGFTLAVQAMALLSGSIAQGSFIMLAFAVGTLPMLLLIGLSAVKFSGDSHFSGTFNKVAAIIVIFFALYNINSQLNVLGYQSLSDIKISSPRSSVVSDIDRAFSGTSKKTNPNANTAEGDFPPIVDGKQIVKMNASARGYYPNKLRVKVGVPVRWEVTDTGTSGCTNAIISKELFDGQIELTPGNVSVKEFTISEPGTYKFSCWMGMVSGTIEAVE